MRPAENAANSEPDLQEQRWYERALGDEGSRLRHAKCSLPNVERCYECSNERDRV
jgi:hypothetical protein